MNGSLIRHLYIAISKQRSHALAGLAPSVTGEEKTIYLLQTHHAVKGVDDLPVRSCRGLLSAWAEPS